MQGHTQTTLTVAIAIGAAASGAALARQCGEGWQVIPGQTGNPGRRGGAMIALDTARHRAVLFGGIIDWGGFIWSRETWELDLDTFQWILAADTGPAVRTEAAFQFDPERQRTVLSGGEDPLDFSGYTYFHETWEWDGATWTLAGSATGDVFAAFTFHSELQRLVKLGGGRRQDVGSPWTFNVLEFSSWTGQGYEAVPPGPPLTAHFGLLDPNMVYDPATQRLIAVGGYSCCFTGQLFAASATVVHDGSTWSFLDNTDYETRVTTLFIDPLTGRPMRESSDGAGLAYWSGTSWVAIEGAPPMTAEFFDPMTRRLVGFKYNETTGKTEAWWRDLDAHPVWVRSRTPAASAITRGLGDDFTLRATVGGATPTNYQWMQDGVPLSDGAGVVGATTDKLEIDPTTCERYGVYDLVVSTACGSGVVASWEVLEPVASVTQSPANTTAAHATSASFTAAIHDPNGPASAWQWRRSGVPIPPGAPYNGVNSAQLTINPVSFAMNGDTFDVVITRACGSQLVTNAATLTVICAGDANGDGVVNFADLNIVLSQFGQSGPNLQGDVVADGVVNFADLNLVLSLFGTGC